ncbi:hypothetical protein T484DRAFT_1772998, partial [Baffinella frigidus]
MRGAATLSPEYVQQLLDHNQQLILATVENQRCGHQAECVQYLKQLHENLFMLAMAGDQE